MGIENKWLIFDKQNTFTQSKLVDFLNEKHKSKKTGTPFTLIDVNKYVKRGHLPSYIGGFKLSLIEDKTGIKVVLVGEPVGDDVINRRGTKKSDDADSK